MTNVSGVDANQSALRSAETASAQAAAKSEPVTQGVAGKQSDEAAVAAIKQKAANAGRAFNSAEEGVIEHAVDMGIVDVNTMTERASKGMSAQEIVSQKHLNTGPTQEQANTDPNNPGEGPQMDPSDVKAKPAFGRWPRM